MPENYARHYYDMFALARSAVCESALGDRELLRKVVEHKMKFYYAGWARYELATPGTLAIVPAAERLAELRRDYDAMSAMFFGEPPSLEEILEEILAELADLETRINRQ